VTHFARALVRRALAEWLWSCVVTAAAVIPEGALAVIIGITVRTSDFFLFFFFYLAHVP
jgi:hypothetical protein